MSDSVERPLLPIACTLGAADGAARVADWRRLRDEYGGERSAAPGSVTLRFRDQDGTGVDLASRLEGLVASERDCCAFLDWQVEQHGDQRWLVITGSDDELAALSFSD